MKRIVLGTQNKNKLREVKQILEPIGYQILSLAEVGLADVDVVEDKLTFEGNAIKKASEISELCQLPVIADDSGLEVDALDGAPGVFSARYGGEHANYAKNNQKLLEALKEVPSDKRTGRFVSVVAYIDVTSGVQHVVRGEIEGVITEELRGEGGFGYDPLFYVHEISMTFAEAAPEIKNKLSHRGRALQKLRQILE